MTENEAIKELSYDNTAYGGRCTEEVRRVAIHALSEIQQCRAIGTVEDIQLIFSLCKDLERIVKKYEAIGTIDEFKALKDAEEQGLLLRLPCKVGDVVYFPIYDYHDSAIIETIRIEENGVFYDWVQYEVGVDCTEVWDNGSFSDGNIGKTVFLTKEEAEQALANMQKA